MSRFIEILNNYCDIERIQVISRKDHPEYTSMDANLKRVLNPARYSLTVVFKETKERLVHTFDNLKERDMEYEHIIKLIRENTFIELEGNIIKINEIQSIEKDINNPFEFTVYLIGRQKGTKYTFGSKYKCDLAMNHIKNSLF